jgi:hypothetical protein
VTQLLSGGFQQGHAVMIMALTINDDDDYYYYYYGESINNELQRQVLCFLTPPKRMQWLQA